MTTLEQKLLDHIFEQDDTIARLELYVAAMTIAATTKRVKVKVTENALGMADATILGLYKRPIKFKVDFSHINKLTIDTTGGENTS